MTSAQGTVNLLLTDPPYDADSVSLYSELSRISAKVLRPGGWCLAYSGQAHLPQVIAALSEQLTYGWMFCAYHDGVDGRFFPLRLFNKFKPILGFYKPPSDVWWEWLGDATNGGREKGLHVWQQPEGEAAYFIERLCPTGGLVFDPMCGSGTTLAAAKSLGRRCVGCEIDPEHVKTCRGRLAEVGAMKDKATIQAEIDRARQRIKTRHEKSLVDRKLIDELCRQLHRLSLVDVTGKPGAVRLAYRLPRDHRYFHLNDKRGTVTGVKRTRCYVDFEGEPVHGRFDSFRLTEDAQGEMLFVGVGR